MSYVIERIDQGGGYVARPGSRGSYTRSLEHAEKYQDEQIAQRNCCENERPANLERLLDAYRR